MRANQNEKINLQTQAINLDMFSNISGLIGKPNKLVKRIEICQQRNLLAAGYKLERQNVMLWNLENQQLIQAFECCQKSTVVLIVFSGEGNLLAFVTNDRWNPTIQLVDISDLKKANIVYQLFGHQKRITSLTFSNNSKLLISGSFDETLRIWDCQSKQENFRLNSKSNVNGVAISEDDTMVASNSLSAKIRIWNLKSRELICSQSAHFLEGYGVQFSNNEKKMLASSSCEGIVKLWSLVQLNQRKLILVKKFKVGSTVVRRLLFSSCSNYIITMGKVSLIMMINEQTGIVQPLLSPEFKNEEAYEYEQGQKNKFVIMVSQNLKIIAYSKRYLIVVLRNV